MAETKGWWGRNWTWAVPAGCLTLAFLFVGAVATLLWLLVSGVQSTEVVQEALARARADDRIVEGLGDPIEPGWWISGSMEFSGGVGTADLTIPIAGPDGSGRLYVEASHEDGVWTYHRLDAKLESVPGRIDLRPPPE